VHVAGLGCPQQSGVGGGGGGKNKIPARAPGETRARGREFDGLSYQKKKNGESFGGGDHTQPQHKPRGGFIHIIIFRSLLSR